MITFTNVWRIFANNHTESIALREINVSIAKGEFVCIAGPSGSGKSTLLNLAGAIDLPDQGEVVIDGQSTTGLNRKQRAILRRHHLGFIFQSYNMLPVLSLFENVEYPLILNGIPAQERHTLVDAALQAVGIYEHRYKRPGELSGGEQQRAAVARAIVGKPPIVLADEPTGSLDSQTGSKLMDTLQLLNRQSNITFIFSSHDQNMIKRADRVILLKDGQVK